MDGLLIDSERIIMQACIVSAKQVGIIYTQAEYVELIGRAGPDSTRIMVEQLGGVENFNQVMQGLDTQLAQYNTPFHLSKAQWTCSNTTKAIMSFAAWPHHRPRNTSRTD